MKLKIVVPFYSEFEAVKPGLRSLMASGILFDVQPVQGPYVHANRNLGINEGFSLSTFQKPLQGYSHALFIDSDISFTPEHVRAALSHGAPVVTLPYLRHENDSTYQVGELGPNLRIEKRYTTLEKGQRLVTFTGGGFLLVQASLFQDITYPWFHHQLVVDGDESYSVGEDVVFSAKLNQAGIPIVCDFDHPVKHRLRTPDDFDVSF